MAEDWPNPAVVSTPYEITILHLTVISQRDAYYHPTVDSSEEPFKWGLPDLDALRGYAILRL